MGADFERWLAGRIMRRLQPAEKNPQIAQIVADFERWLAGSRLRKLQPAKRVGAVMNRERSLATKR
ncbi:MAG: hypothetical protein CVV41_02375 [Candidatus Riflebacteria bacterium HGW-Riflebacteria-1]|nr:MAG: hypothetical protein CVV41_02375 [Candidatus Riflebacteria bacterium HGW-Riflebacteria-1]